MLSAPGFRFHRTLTPFFQLVVGPALPAILTGVRVNPFLYCGFLVSCVMVYFYYCFILFCVYCNARAPAYLGYPGWVYAWVTQDVTCDSVPHAWVPPPCHVRTCLLPNP